MRPIMRKPHTQWIFLSLSHPLSSNKHLKVKPNITSALLILRFILRVFYSFLPSRDLRIIYTCVSFAHCLPTGCQWGVIQSDSRRASTPYILPNKNMMIQCHRWFRADRRCWIHFWFFTCRQGGGGVQQSSMLTVIVWITSGYIQPTCG